MINIYLIIFNLTTFNNNIVPMEKNHYICIPVIDIDSVLKIDKKAYPQAYLEECKYKLKKRKLVSFIDSEIIDDDSDDGYDIDNENNFPSIRQLYKIKKNIVPIKKVCSQVYLKECDLINEVDQS